jgi:hypothetical protein
MITQNISTGVELAPPQYNTQIGVMNSDGSGITKIISGGVMKTKISWSPDGTIIAYTSLSRIQERHLLGFCRRVGIRNHRDQWLECRLAALTLKES